MLIIGIASIFSILKLNLKNKALILFMFIFIFLTTILSNQHYFNRNFNLTKNEVFSKSKELSSIKIFSPKHDSLYRTAYNIFLENKIYGAGPKSFRYICDKKVYKHNDNSCSTHPHNFPLQILSELGIIGFLIYLFVYSTIILRIFFSKDNFLAKLMLTCFLINFFPLIPSGNLFNNWLSSIIYLPMGFYLYFNKEKNKI
jgi:O-antigen ligase